MNKLFIFILTIFIVANCYYVSDVDAVWFNDTRDYKRPIVIEGIGLDMPEDYQKILEIDYDSDMLNNFDDLQTTWLNTTDSEEYQIDYWIESQNDGTNITLWAEVPVIYNETTNTTVYIYYGNNSGSVNSESNASATLGAGIDHLYTMRNNANDMINNDNGTVYGAIPTTDRNSISNEAYYFDGTNDYITFSTITNYPTSTFTFSFWYNRLIDSGGWERVFSISDTGSADVQFQITNADVIMLSIIDNVTSDVCYSTTTETTNTAEWMYLTGTFDGQYLKVYKNGVLKQNTNCGVITPKVSALPINFGRLLTIYDAEIKIDDARFYNKDLTQEQIESMYAPTEPNYTIGAEESSNTVPTVTANVSNPSPIYTNNDWLINLTATDPDTGDNLTGYVNFYVNTTFIGLYSSAMTNNTNTLVATLQSSNFSNADNLTAETWVGDDFVNTTAVNITVTVQDIFVVTLNSPDNETITTDNTPDFNFTVANSASDYNCELFIDDIGYGVNATTLNDVPTIITANSTVSDATYDWYVNCSYDATVNQSEIREITIDTTAPQISIYSPRNTTYNTTTINLDVSAVESNPDTWWYSLNGGINTTFTPNTTTDFSVYCYQESVNVSTSCGGVSTGVYSGIGSTWYDGNWGTSYSIIEGTSVYMNYTKPANSLNTSLWVGKSGSTGDFDGNMSIPQTCWDYNDTTLIFRYNAVSTKYFQCYNGVSWVTTGGTGNGYVVMWEEAMWWDILEYNEGQNNITVWANDTVGNENNSDMIYFTIDTIFPQIEFVSPTYTNNTNITNTYTYINWTVTEINQDTMIFNWNGTNSTVTNEYINKISLADGAYTYYVWVNDTASNSNQTETRTITIDTTKPVTTINDTNSDWRNTTLQFTLSCDDGIGVGCDIILYCKDVAGTCTPNTVYSSAVSVTTQGESYVRYNSNDTLNNTELIKQQLYRIDTVPPQIIINSPENTTYYDIDEIDLNILTEDIENIWYSYNGGENKIINTTYESTQFCYQETANISTSCGGLDTGLYSLVDNYLYINYTNPERSTNNTIWTVKHGFNDTYNITLPITCSNRNIIELRMFSNLSYYTPWDGTSYSQCFNGTWNTIGSVSLDYHWVGSIYRDTLHDDNIYDENWNTYLLYNEYYDDWFYDIENPTASGQAGPNAARLFEEAIWWNVTYDIYNILIILDETPYHNITVWANDTIGNLNSTTVFFSLWNTSITVNYTSGEYLDFTVTSYDGIFAAIGQNDTTPAINITNVGNVNLYINVTVNTTQESCMTFWMSEDATLNISEDYNVTDTTQTIITDLEINESDYLWAWMQFDSCTVGTLIWYTDYYDSFES